jgi:hypothetical protein
MNWGIRVFGENLDTKDTFFIQVAIDDEAVGIFQPVLRLCISEVTLAFRNTFWNSGEGLNRNCFVES